MKTSKLSPINYLSRLALTFAFGNKEASSLCGQIDASLYDPCNPNQRGVNPQSYAQGYAEGMDENIASHQGQAPLILRDLRRGS